MSFFPKHSFSKTKPIKVPSCLEHNQKKSQLDEYLRFILIAVSPRAPEDVTVSASRGIVRLLKKESKNIGDFGVSFIDGKVNIHESAPIILTLLIESLEKIARGIYFHHSDGESKLVGTLATYPIFLGIDPNATKEERAHLIEIGEYARQDIEEYEMLGENQDIFAYQVIESAEIIVINMVYFAKMAVSIMHDKSNK